MSPRYKFTCGCEYPVTDVKKRLDPNTRKQSVTCPVHGAEIESVIVQCIKCKTDIEIPKLGGYLRNRTCATCKAMSKKRPEAPRRTECIHYDRCITPPSGFLVDEPRACTYCRHYEARDNSMDILAHVRCGDTFQEVRA